MSQTILEENLVLLPCNDSILTVESVKNLFEFVEELENSRIFYKVTTDEGKKVRPPFYGWNSTPLKYRYWLL